MTFSSCLHSFPASGSSPVSQLFASCGQIIGASASASVLPINIQGSFPLGLTGLISLLSKGLSKVFSSTSLKASILQHSVFLMVQISHPYMTTGKIICSVAQSCLTLCDPMDCSMPGLPFHHQLPEFTQSLA